MNDDVGESVPGRLTLKLDGVGSRGISSYLLGGAGVGFCSFPRLTLNDFGGSCAVFVFAVVFRTGLWVDEFAAGLEGEFGPDPGPDLLATLNDLPSCGVGTPANIAPLSAASAAFRALFSSRAISAISSKLFFFFKPNIPLHPGVDLLGVLGRPLSLS